jgi:CHAD domain-containing protein/HD superfamily phosphodiesterase
MRNGKVAYITEVIAPFASPRPAILRSFALLVVAKALCYAVELTLDPQSPTEISKKPRPVGFAYWMERVLEECARAAQSFAADPVHDLRVSLRRCRSMADGLMAVDPHPSWKQMKKAGKRLFSSLGDLRDVQVMRGWVEELGAIDDPETKALLGLLAQREDEQKARAAEALKAFDTRQWKKWARELPVRAGKVRKGSLIFRHLALEHWVRARDLHRRSMRNRSQVALHNLRIGIKKFRYIVENFLPHEHHAWGDDLKELQDVLGEIHDFDVLWATALRVNAFATAESRRLWRERIVAERAKRLDRYREKMLGNSSLWSVWRASLPQGQEIEKAALERMRLWASLLDPQFHHTQHVADLTSHLLQELMRLGLIHGDTNASSKLERILEAAALMHDVGLAKGYKGHHKVSWRLIRRMSPPLGWTAEDLLLAAAVARFHRGALPNPRHKALRGFTPEHRNLAILLAGVLRLAVAFDARSDGRVHRVHLEDKNGALVLWAQGFQPMTRKAEAVAAARYVLEAVLRRPIIVRVWRLHVVRRMPRAASA